MHFFLNSTIHPIDNNEKQKDLGVIVDTKLFFEDQINKVVNEATKMTKIIRRTFQILDKYTFLSLYEKMVRMHIDYTISIWYIYTQKHIIAVEYVQRRATKELTRMTNQTYAERLNKLKLPPIAYKRLRCDMRF